jgi:heme/copper-type cytochrome/quinol oxidase subunit 2
MGPVLRGHTRRLALIWLLTALAFGAGAVLAASAGADAFTPDAGPTKNAVDIDTLYKIAFYTGLAIVGMVWAVLFYSLFRFRARRGRDRGRARDRHLHHAAGHQESGAVGP